MKTAVVTGGNSGIGFETARELARRGWRVIITGRDEAKLRAAADAIGAAATVQVADFASFADVRALGAALNQEPRIDVLVNNIGVSLSRQQQSRDGNDMMLQVNHLSAVPADHPAARQAQGERARAHRQCVLAHASQCARLRLRRFPVRALLRRRQGLCAHQALQRAVHARAGAAARRLRRHRERAASRA